MTPNTDTERLAKWFYDSQRNSPTPYSSPDEFVDFIETVGYAVAYKNRQEVIAQLSNGFSLETIAGTFKL